MKSIPKDKTLTTTKKRENNDSDLKSVRQLIASHNFASRVQVILPAECQYEPTHRPTTYKVNCSLLTLVTDLFLNACIKHGSCIALSDGKLDHGDVFCIVNGCLYMSLTKALYQRAGIQGKRSRHSKERYFITYDLKSPGFVPGSSVHDRLVWSLKNTPLGAVKTFAIALGQGVRMNDDLEKLFATSDLRESTIEPRIEPRGLVSIPDMHPPQNEGDHDEWAGCLFEWAGLVSLGSNVVDSTQEIDPYLCNYQVLDPVKSQSVKVATWNGGDDGLLMTNELVKRVYDSIPDTDWAIINVFGPESAPVAWKDHEHCYITRGENIYTVVRTTDHVTTFRHVSGEV